MAHRQPRWVSSGRPASAFAANHGTLVVVGRLGGPGEDAEFLAEKAIVLLVNDNYFFPLATIIICQ
jgi:hypothetical protein